MSIRSSASIILCTLKSQTAHVLLVKRSGNGPFPSIHSFPGGTVQSPADQKAAAQLNWPVQRFTAIRECFEECGILPGYTPTLFPENTSLMAEQQGIVKKDPLAFAKLIHSLNHPFKLPPLIPFANWITPPHEPKRFDSMFYLSVLSSNQKRPTIHIDNHEIVDHLWLEPLQAIQEHKKGLIRLYPPQYYFMYQLDQFFKDKSRHVSVNSTIESIQPELVMDKRKGTSWLVLPGDHSHSIPNHPLFLEHKGVHRIQVEKTDKMGMKVVQLCVGDSTY